MASTTFDTLLDKLATDDAFREQMLGDPVKALGSLGIVVDPAAIPAVRTLPSKDSLLNDRDALKAATATDVGMFPFSLASKP